MGKIPITIIIFCLIVPALIVKNSFTLVLCSLTSLHLVLSLSFSECKIVLAHLGICAAEESTISVLYFPCFSLENNHFSKENLFLLLEIGV